MTLKNNAVQKLSIPNPLTKFAQSIIIKAFTTNKNNPKVKIVTGKVNSTKIGFTNKLSNPKTTATTTDVPKPATVTPGKKLAIRSTKIEVIKILIIKFIIN